MTPPADSTKDDGGLAFSTEIDAEDSKGYPITGKIIGGMSLRDWFAGMALQGILAESSHPQSTGSWKQAKEFAKTAYEFSDAMLAERKKP